IAVEKIDPHEFLAFVHDVDLSCVPQNPALAAALRELPGTKLVYTNGSVPHAERLLAHLGIGASFSGIFDIVAANFEPKPALAPYRQFLARYRIEPSRALMVEDMTKNLVPAARRTATTSTMSSTISPAFSPPRRPRGRRRGERRRCHPRQAGGALRPD